VDDPAVVRNHHACLDLVAGVDGQRAVGGQVQQTGHIARQDVVITTAQVPGRRPPLLVTEDAVKAMSPGSVIVDMGASALGGNVSGSQPGETMVTGNGVTIVGADNLPATVPAAASAAYSRNISALLLHLTKDGALAIDTGDEIQAGVVIAHDGAVVHPGVASLLQPAQTRLAGPQPTESQPDEGGAGVDGPSH
jgi:NAD(P) transhydrogenase subunit alpha